MILGLLQTIRPHANFTGRFHQRINRLPRKVRHGFHATIVEQRKLVVFIDSKPLCIFHQLSLGRFNLSFNALDVLLQRSNPRRLLGGSLNLARQLKNPFPQRKFARLLANFTPLELEFLLLFFTLLALLRQFFELFSYGIRQISSGSKAFDAIVKIGSLRPGWPHLNSNFVGLRFKLPLSDAFFQLIEF